MNLDNDTLTECLKEIRGWHNTGLLNGDVLRSVAAPYREKFHVDMGMALQMAERDVLRGLADMFIGGEIVSSECVSGAYIAAKKAVMEELLSDDTGDLEDGAYNRAILHAVGAIDDLDAAKEAHQVIMIASLAGGLAVSNQIVGVLTEMEKIDRQEGSPLSSAEALKHATDVIRDFSKALANTVGGTNEVAADA